MFKDSKPLPNFTNWPYARPVHEYKEAYRGLDNSEKETVTSVINFVKDFHSKNVPMLVTDDPESESDCSLVSLVSSESDNTSGSSA